MYAKSLRVNMTVYLSQNKQYQERRHTQMKPPAATPGKRVKETEKNVQKETWKFIAATPKPGVKCLLENYRRTTSQLE